MDVNGMNIEILQRLSTLETKMDMIIEVKGIAFEAQQSVKSAHKRLDTLEIKTKADTDNISRTVDKHIARMDKIVFWGASTTIGSLIIGAIGLLFYFVKKGM